MNSLAVRHHKLMSRDSTRTLSTAFFRVKDLSKKVRDVYVQIMCIYQFLNVITVACFSPKSINFAFLPGLGRNYRGK